MRPLSMFLVRGLVAFALLAPAALVGGASPVSAAAFSATGACATGIGNAGGQGIICDVTIVNSITTTGGSATVKVHECLGSAGDPTDGALGHPCTTSNHNVSAPVTAVTQCDGSANGGGGTLRCSVTITNNFYNVAPGSAAVTVNQCVGSGDGATTGCDPFPATTSGAAITQCNGSANGGTLVQLTCHASGTMASALDIAINQCNGSALGGGGLVICSASMVNRALQLPAPTATVEAGSITSNPLLPLMLVLALGGFVLAAVVTTKRRGVRI
jgi:hypothetical protein